MAYGFRLFEVELFSGRHRPLSAHPWLTADGRHYVDHAVTLLEHLTALQYRLEAKPDFDLGRSQTSLVAPPVRNGDRVVRWMSYERTSSRHLAFQLEYGTVGSHKTAMDVARSSPLTGLAPGQYFRCEMLLPDFEGPGLLVVETSGLSCPVECIPRWLTIASETYSTPDEPWFRLAARPMVDEKHLQRMLENGQVEVVLTGVGPSLNGLPTGSEVKLEVKVANSLRGGVFRTLVDHMRGSVKTPRDLLAVIQMDQAVSGLDFADGRIRIKTADETKTIPLSRVKEIFTYPTSKNLPPSPDLWRSTVRGKVREMRDDLIW